MIEIVTGIPGSGKTYLLTWKLLRAMVRGRNTATNYDIDEGGCYAFLRRAGLSPQVASSRIDRHVVVRTYEQLRSLHDTQLCFSEAHLWFFSRMWERISMQEIQFWSQVRKAGVDACLDTQRLNAIDASVRDLAAHVWWARPLYTPPFPTLAYLHNKVSRSWNRLGIGLTYSDWPKMFLYTHTQSELGRVRTDSISSAINNKSIIPLDLYVARAYTTGKIYSSPLVEETFQEAKLARLKSIYLGDMVPQGTCATCRGKAKGSFSLVQEDGRWTWQSAPLSGDFVQYRPCPVCDGTGFLPQPDSAEVTEAFEVAERLGWGHAAGPRARSRRTAARGAA